MNSQSCEQAVAFIKELFQVYLVQRNFEKLLDMMHPQVSWFGTGAHEVCCSYQDAVRLLEQERDVWNGRFKIITQWYKSVQIAPSQVTVYGELCIKEEGLSIFLQEMPARFSMVCVLEGGQWKLLHGHFSVPNAAQAEDEFVHRNLVDGYNELLEQALQDRTRMLEEKTRELESLADNILGGVLICVCDDVFTVEYASNGFYGMTGYSAQELADGMKNAFVEMIYPPDMISVRKQLKEQLSERESFSIIYRLMHRNGGQLWVLDNGRVVGTSHGEPRIQSILTDITAQKEQEQLLRISEKRYEIVMQCLDVDMFEYNIQTRELLFFEKSAQIYHLGSVIPNGPDTLVSNGWIHPSYADEYREMYRKIHAGEPVASCSVLIRSHTGELGEYELTLTNIFDNEGMPLRAIGVRRNVSQIRALQKEQEFGRSLVVDKRLIFEADLARDELLYLADEWRVLSGMKPGDSLSETLQVVVPCVLVAEHVNRFLKTICKEHIVREYERGERLFSIEYQRKSTQYDSANGVHWYEGTVNIIRDPQTGSLTVRFYHANIDERKCKEKRALEEKRLYETMVNKAMVAYEVNLTRNLALTGHENWDTLYGIRKSHNYAEMIAAFCRKGICPEESGRFAAVFQREHVLDAYRRGERQVSCQYRKLDSKQAYVWVQCTLHLYEDPSSGDIKGYAYVEDIDKQKREELELRYTAEHDAMTRLYNKATMERLVDAYLQAESQGDRMHAFIILDVDYFKQINDTFGHIFGDKVLVDVASQIRGLFRKRDLVGRLGGDEFVILMKDVRDDREVLDKAAGLCEVMRRTYSQDGQSGHISASVGVALYKRDGSNFAELYRHADRSLYAVKRRGRNGFSL